MARKRYGYGQWIAGSPLGDAIARALADAAAADDDDDRGPDDRAAPFRSPTRSIDAMTTAEVARALTRDEIRARIAVLLADYTREAADEITLLLEELGRRHRAGR